MPPLRRRREDIPALVARFLMDLGDARAIDRIDKPTLDRLVRHDWPGNVRELRNVVIAAHAQSGGGPIEVGEALNARTRVVGVSSVRGALRGSFHEQKRALLEDFERQFFAELHRETGGNISEMSRRSGLERSGIREYLTRHGIRGSD